MTECDSLTGALAQAQMNVGQVGGVLPFTSGCCVFLKGGGAGAFGTGAGLQGAGFQGVGAARGS